MDIGKVSFFLCVLQGRREGRIGEEGMEVLDLIELVDRYVGR